MRRLNISVLRVAPVPVLHRADAAHNPNADGERARVDGGVARRGIPAVPSPEVDPKPRYNKRAVHEPKIKASVTFYNVNLF